MTAGATWSAASSAVRWQGRTQMTPCRLTAQRREGKMRPRRSGVARFMPGFEHEA